MSVLNAKSSPVPASWMTKVGAFLKKIGYRLVLKQLTHPKSAGSLSLSSQWDNKGVAGELRPRRRGADRGRHQGPRPAGDQRQAVRHLVPGLDARG